MAEYVENDIALLKSHGLDTQEFSEFYGSATDDALPGYYAPSCGGSLYLATCSGKGAGCAAFHRLDNRACEMKRVFVRPEFRRLNIGRELVKQLISAAREIGYCVMRLETITIVPGARPLYSSLGFTVRDPYYAIPRSFQSITLFMELDLRTQPC
jgi:putative acetyltransferase